MRTPSPHRMLFLLWAVALVILIGGILLSRQERQMRIDRDREAVRGFTSVAQAQLQRLEGLYQDHLLQLGKGLVPDQLEAGRMADEITGILQVSLLHAGAEGRQDFHAIINASPDGPPALPAFSQATGFEVPVVLLDENQLFSLGSGWIDEPGKPLMFFVTRTSSEIAVITVSRPAVSDSIRAWLGIWAEKRFEPVRVTGGPDRLREGQQVLAEVGVPVTEQPDLVLPLLSRFCNIELASWDVRKTVVEYHPATLAATATLAVIIALLAVVVFIAQSRDQAIATQRVSFVNRVSHELRTPLTNILLNVDLAIELAEESPEESENRLGLVRIEARRLARMIENVLTFSRTEEGKMEIKPVACVPAEIVSSLIDQFSPSFRRRGLTVERVDEDTETSCLCDPDALSQILGNLLSNVEKYVPGGEVGILTRVADDELLIRVSDHGPGIPQEAAEFIFRPFERIHSKVNEGSSGTGLGLSIARDLANRLGGTLILLPQVSGSCFELRIPAPPLPTGKISV